MSEVTCPNVGDVFLKVDSGEDDDPQVNWTLHTRAIQSNRSSRTKKYNIVSKKLEDELKKYQSTIEAKSVSSNAAKAISEVEAKGKSIK